MVYDTKIGQGNDRIECTPYKVGDSALLFKWFLSLSDLFTKRRPHRILSKTMQSCTNIDGQLLAASCGSVVKTWNPLEDGSKYTRPVFFTNTYRIESVAWNLGGTLLAYGGDHSVVSVKDWTNRTSRTFPSDNKASLRRLGFGFDGNSLVAAGTDGCVTIWNCKNEVNTTLRLPINAY